MNSQALSLSFLLKIPSNSDGYYLEYEFGFNELFGELVLEIVTELINRKLLNPGEFYDYYLLPHYDDMFIQGKENVKVENSSPPIDDILISDQVEIKITEEMLTEQPIKYLELVIKSSPIRISYSRHFSLNEIKPAVDRAISMSSKLPKRYAGNVSNPYALIAKFDLDHNLKPIPKIIVFASNNAQPNFKAVIESSPEDLDAINIDVSHEIIGQSASLTEFGNLSKTNKSLNSIILSKRTVARLLEQSSGTFGILVGVVFKNDGQEGYIVEIKETIVIGSYSYGLSLKFDDLANSLRISQTRFPNDRIVGWYRSSTDFDIGLKKTDQSAHLTLFPDEWQCFLLVRSDISNISPFVSIGGSLVYTNEFYIRD